MNRRLVGLAVAFAWLVACGGHSAGPSPIPPAAAVSVWGARVAAGTALPEPPVVRAVNGVAKLKLVAQDDYSTGLPTFYYKGEQGVMPTIDVKPGESFAVDVVNDLPTVPPPNAEMQTVSPMGTGMQEDINLHFHGLGSSPKRPGDDVLTMLAKPGQTLHYLVRVPATQEPGLYWYHPHVHAETNFQVGRSGMSGAIVVEGIERHLPGLAKMTHRLIIVRATGGTGDVRPAGSNKTPCVFNDGTTTALNGVVAPVISIARGEKQFFRLINATGHRTLKLAVDGEKLELVAIDGFALDSYPGTPPTQMESSIIVPPASRAEFIVTGPAGGHAKLRTLCYDTGPNGDPDPPLVLAELRAPAPGTSTGYRSSSPLTVGAPLPRNVFTTQLPAPTAKRLVVLSESGAPKFFINGKSYSVKAKPMFVVHVGTVEEWTIENVTQEIHDFHIHQTHFVIESIDGVKVEHPHWADSTVVPHRRTIGNKSVPGELVLLMDFRDPLIKGEFLFHCHILDHEDEGMMAKIEAI
jgi:suppressor of ftsI